MNEIEKSQILLKHAMSCLEDELIGIEIDRQRRQAILSLYRIDSSLIAEAAMRVLPGMGVVAFRDDNQATEAWTTPRAPYRLFVDVGDVRYRVQVVRLYNRQDVAVTLEPVSKEARPPLEPNLQRLVDAHPDLFRGEGPEAASYVPDGWYSLVDRLCSDIESTLGAEACAQTVVTQVKEKYGQLRLYVRFGERRQLHVDAVSDTGRTHQVLDAEPSGDTSLDSREDRVKELLRAAEMTSMTLCERCGGPGASRKVGGWLTTLCDHHLAEAEKVRSRPAPAPIRILVLSDLHLEFGTSFTPPEAEYGVVILGGDIQSPGRKAVAWAQRGSVFSGRPVIIVPGNHEYYGAPSLDQELASMRELAKGSNVHVLDRDAVVIDGIRFLGCTLWTDFQLPIKEVDSDQQDTNVEVSLAAANRWLSDFESIQVTAPATRQSRYREFKRRLRAQDTLAMHWRDRDWLRRELQRPFDGPTVVVTHHAPSSRSVAAQYVGDALSPAFASELPEDFFGVPVVWVHGHTHSTASYLHSGSRVVSNPRGYTLKDGSFENSEFDRALVIEVTRR